MITFSTFLGPGLTLLTMHVTGVRMRWSWACAGHLPPPPRASTSLLRSPLGSECAELCRERDTRSGADAGFQLQRGWGAIGVGASFDLPFRFPPPSHGRTWNQFACVGRTGRGRSLASVSHRAAALHLQCGRVLADIAFVDKQSNGVVRAQV